jgi:hypothetical protein
MPGHAEAGQADAGRIDEDMRWRNRDWPERPPRPKAAKLPREALDRLHTCVVEFVRESVVLRELLQDVQLARGRIYLWREPDDLMARITPLGPRSMLLESPRGDSWIESKRGQLAALLKVLEGDTLGTFHGLGSLVAKQRGGKPTAQVVLHRELNIPIRVLAEPRYWYSMHRKPVIAEVNDAKDRVLIRFVAHGLSCSFHGTCLYARRDGEWGCYTIRPNASESIASAEAWLEKRDWEDWG